MEILCVLRALYVERRVSSWSRLARIHLHQPLGGVSGQVADIEIHAKEYLKMRQKLNEILAHHTGQSVERLEKDTDRDFYMSPEEAREYGLIDDVIAKRA